MIKAYLVGISTHYENEDIEIRYRIFINEEFVSEKTIFQEYKKPLIVSHVALLALLKELEKYMEYDITIIINDAALNELIRGTSKTKNNEVLKMSNLVREELNKFNSIIIKDVSANPVELKKWNDELQP